LALITAEVTATRSSAGSPLMTPHADRRALRDHRGALRRDVDGVGAGRALERDDVGHAVAGGPGHRQVHGHQLRRGRGQIADGDDVDATAPRAELDALDSVEIHVDRRDVARHPQPAALGGQLEVLADVGAVEDQQVLAGVALDDVALVPGFQAMVSSPSPMKTTVGATAGGDHVVAGAAVEGLGTDAAGDRVVCRRRREDGDHLLVGERAEGLVHPDDVVAALGVDEDAVELRTIEAEVRRPVVADVHVESRGGGGAQAQGQLRRIAVAGDGQEALRDLRRVARLGHLELTLVARDVQPARIRDRSQGQQSKCIPSRLREHGCSSPRVVPHPKASRVPRGTRRPHWRSRRPRAGVT
jgi:hypothetical protein